MTLAGSHVVQPPAKVGKTPDDLRVLVFAPRGREGDLIAAALDRAGISCEVRTHPRRLAATVEHIGALVLTADALTPSLVALLNKAFDAQPLWSSTPLIILLPQDVQGLHTKHRDPAMKLGRHAIILALPMNPATLVSVVGCALEMRRRQYQVRNLQAGLEPPPTKRRRLSSRTTARSSV